MTQSTLKSKILPRLVPFVLTFAAAASAQTLARPGWTGSGLSTQSWSKHAVLYEIDTRSFQDTNGDGIGDLKGIAQHLDYLKALGVDAILLEPLTAAAPAQPGSQPAPIDPALGTIDDFDDLSLQASRHNIRILLDLPNPDPGLARFWLTRGVAGFHIPGSTDANAAAIQAIQKLLPKYAGQRILITDAELAAAGKHSPDQLVLDSEILRIPSSASANRAAELRAALEHSQAMLRSATPVLVTDAAGLPRSQNRFADAAHEADAAKLIGTVLLLNRSVSLIYAGQELGLSSPTGAPVTMPWVPPPAPPVTDTPPPAPKPVPPPSTTPSDTYVPYVRPVAPPKPVPPDPATAAGQDLNPNSTLNFYRQLVQLHHGTSPLRDGEEILINHDDQGALIWVRKPPVPSQQNPAIVILCNLSGKPLVVSLKDDMARLHLRGSFLRKILRSDDALGSMYLDPITIPPFGVYVGELRF